MTKLGDFMKKIFLKIFHVLQNIGLFLLGIFFSFIPERKKEKKVVEKQVEKLEQKKNTVIEEEQENPSGETREKWQEYLKQTNKSLSIPEQIDFWIEKIYHINIQDLEELEKEEVKKYKNNLLEKIEARKRDHCPKEQLNNFLIEQITKDKQEFNKKLQKKTEALKYQKEEPQKETQVEIKIPIDTIVLEEKKEVKKQNYEPIREPQTIAINIPTEEPNQVIEQKPVKRIEEEIKEANIEKKTINILSPIPKPIIEKNRISEITVPEEQYKEEIYLIPEEQMEVSGIKEEEKEIKIPESVLEESQVIKNNPPKKEERKDEKKVEVKKDKLEIKEKEEPILIPVNEIVEETKKIETAVTKELGKEEFEEKEYEEIETLLKSKITYLESLLPNPLKKDHKEIIESKIIKLKQLRERVRLNKEQDLEVIRVSLEEYIKKEEIDQIKNKIKEFQNKEQLERLEQIQNKTKREVEKIDKLYIKKALCKMNQRLELSLLLSFPFIKNKYFRKLISGVFIFSGLSFIKNILFKSQIEEYEWLQIEKGQDALKESIFLIEKNINMLNEMKRTIAIKYPELEYDEEFLYYLYNVEQNLTKSYEKALKQEHMVNKYFHKAQVLSRKRRI